MTESRRADLTTLAGAGKSQNYTYTLASKAIVAKRDVKNGYTLMMPYKSGQICCMGNGCSGLNKDYPGCPSEFGADECEADADYIEQKEADHGCVCYDKNGVERGAGYVESQSCSYGPAQTHTCLQSGNTCNWSTWSKCQTAPEPPQPPQSCSVCQDGDTQYALGAQETRACPGGGMESRTCSKNGDVCSMSGWSGCETEPEPEPETC